MAIINCKTHTETLIKKLNTACLKFEILKMSQILQYQKKNPLDYSYFFTKINMGLYSEKTLMEQIIYLWLKEYFRIMSNKAKFHRCSGLFKDF